MSDFSLSITRVKPKVKGETAAFLLLILVSALGFVMELVFLGTLNVAGCILGHRLLNCVAPMYWVLSGEVG
jgi:hypothetical protein